MAAHGPLARREPDPPHIPGYRVPPEEQAPEGEHEPLFPYGHGLRLADPPTADDPLPEDTWQDDTPVPRPPDRSKSSAPRTVRSCGGSAGTTPGRGRTSRSTG
ncbi:hypothetical protein [Kitasatospora paranensis]|uniref:hypothetical protein n=1 Tax=Kitasatospora paranensis TaxID=258053 RepID=UPI0031E6C658